MWIVKRSGTCLRLCLVVLMTCGWISGNAAGQAKTDEHSARPPQAVSIGGEPVVVLQRPRSTDKSQPQFLKAAILPGRGMAVLQIKAYIPGKGEIDLLNAPPLREAEQLLDKSDDEFGNQVFKIGGAILLPFANRIRGKVSPDGKSITADVAGKPVTLPANWSGNKPGAEKHAIHGLLLNSKLWSVYSDNGPQESIVVATLCAGDFGGHWFSRSDIRVEVRLKDDLFDLLVTVRDAGHAPLPIGIGWHPYFVLPSGDRAGPVAIAERQSRRHE